MGSRTRRIACNLRSHFSHLLKGKGGKGIATFVGIGLTFNLLFAIAFIVAFSLVFPFIRSATLSMIFGYLAYIGSVFYFNEVESAWPIIVAIVLILYRHRFDFQQSFDDKNGNVHNIIK